MCWVSRSSTRSRWLSQTAQCVRALYAVRFRARATRSRPAWSLRGCDGRRCRYRTTPLQLSACGPNGRFGSRTAVMTARWHERYTPIAADLLQRHSRQSRAIGRPMQHDAIRRSVAEGTKRWPLKFTAGNEASGAGLSDNLAVVVHDLSATDSRLRKSGDVHARIRRVLCIRELLRIV